MKINLNNSKFTRGYFVALLFVGAVTVIWTTQQASAVQQPTKVGPGADCSSLTLVCDSAQKLRCVNNVCVKSNQAPSSDSNKNNPPAGTTGTGGNSNPSGVDTSGYDLGIDLNINQVELIIQGIACWLLRMSSVALILAVLYVGALYFRAAGNPSKITEANQAFKYVVIGIAVIVGVYGIIGTVATVLEAGSYSFFTCTKK